MASANIEGFQRDTVTGALLVTGAGSTEGLPGAIAPSGAQWAGTAAAVTAGRIYYARVSLAERKTLTKLAFGVTTFDVNDDNVEVGIYSSAGARLVTSGAVAGKLNATNGVKTVTIASTTLDPGVYYTAWVVGTAAAPPTMLMATFGGTVIAYELFGTAVPNVLAGQEAGTSLPATMTISSITGNTVVVALRES